MKHSFRGLTRQQCAAIDVIRRFGYYTISGFDRLCRKEANTLRTLESLCVRGILQWERDSDWCRRFIPGTEWSKLASGIIIEQ